LCHAWAAQAVHPCSTLGSEEQLVLPGYGVEAVLKNMEYSAMDDKAKADAAAAAKKAAKAKAGAGSSDDLSEIDVASLGEVKGFKFDVLAQRKPHLVQELLTFRDVLMSNDEEEAIKVCSVPEVHLPQQPASHHCATSYCGLASSSAVARCWQVEILKHDMPLLGSK
jgi:hypothetical protein